MLTDHSKDAARLRPRPKVPNNGRCQKCSSEMLYHDYDPTKFHNGYTCLSCGFEQDLVEGGKSILGAR